MEEVASMEEPEGLMAVAVAAGLEMERVALVCLASFLYWSIFKC